MDNVHNILDVEEIAFIDDIQNKSLLTYDVISEEEEIMRFNDYINDVVYEFLNIK